MKRGVWSKQGSMTSTLLMYRLGLKSIAGSIEFKLSQRLEPWKLLYYIVEENPRQPFSKPIRSPSLNTDATAVRTSMLDITVVPGVVNAHLPLRATESGDPSAKLGLGRIHADTWPVSGHAASLHVRVIHAHRALGARHLFDAEAAARRVRRARGLGRLGHERRLRGLGRSRGERGLGLEAPACAVLAALGRAGRVVSNAGVAGPAGRDLEAARGGILALSGGEGEGRVGEEGEDSRETHVGRLWST